MAIKYVVDTHPLLWFLSDSPRLGPNADTVLQDPDSELILPAMAFAEACWICEHGRVTLSVERLLAAIDADARFTIHPLDRSVIQKSTALTTINEMHDRQIVATGLVLAERGDTVCMLTRDENITASGLIPVIW